MDLDLQVSPLQRAFREITGMPLVVFLRKLEFLFYFLFIILALTCIVMPPVFGLAITPLYIAAGLSLAYAVCIYFLRYRIYAHFALMVHSGILLVFSSTIFFESGYIKVGTAMAVIGVLSVAMVFVFASLGRKVVVRPRGGGGRRPPAQQPPREGDALMNQLLRRDLIQNPVFAAGLLNNLDGILADEHVGQPDLEDDLDNNRNPVLPNGPENNPNEDSEDEPDDHALPNGHAVQMRDGPDVQPEEGRNEDVVRQRLNVNEQVGQQREDVDDPQQREDVNEQVVQE